VSPAVKRVLFAILLIALIAAVGGGSVTSTAAPAPTPTPMPTPAPLSSRVINIMLLGIDRRPPDEDWRTDTMILVSIDPREKIVSLVSIPRDLYVSIPGHGKSRVNMTDRIGEAEHYPGGGPRLLKATLEDNLGITFDHYIRIDFQGFVEMIDLLGGVDVDVRCPTELWVPDMKRPGEYRLFRTVPAGMQHMDGEYALIYSRCRAHTIVFDRDRRQREMLLAIRNRVLELGVSGLLPRLFELLETMQHNVQTDLEPAEILALAQLLRQIPPHNVSQRAIDLTVASEWTTPEGSWVMLPDRRQIKELMEERMVPPTWEESSLAEEGVRIAVDNGTTIDGFSFQMADRLRSRGYQVAEVGKADRLDYTETIIISYTGASFTLDRLRQYLHVGEADIRYEPDWLSRVHIRVILGNDAQPLCPASEER
jgi:LCP family protein required for cell wall assembly